MVKSSLVLWGIHVWILPEYFARKMKIVIFSVFVKSISPAIFVFIQGGGCEGEKDYA